jgi:hypothetical protein
MNGFFKALAICAFALSASANVEIVGVSGAYSGLSSSNAMTVIYAGQISLGVCGSTDGYSTCDACTNIPVGTACSSRYVPNGSNLVLTVLADKSAPIYVTSASGTVVLSKNTQAGANTNIILKWEDICSSGGAFMCSGFANMSQTLFVHVGNESKSILVQRQSVATPHQSGCVDSQAEGLCDFKIERVNPTNAVLDLDLISSYPARRDGLPFLGARLFYKELSANEECSELLCTSMPGSTPHLDILIDDDKTFENIVGLDFSHGQKYCVKLANLDVAYDVTSATDKCVLLK